MEIDPMESASEAAENGPRVVMGLAALLGWHLDPEALSRLLS